MDSYEGTFDKDKGINVSIECIEKSWSDSPALSDHISLSGNDVESYEASMNAYGDFLFAWQQNDKSNQSRIYKSEYKYKDWKVKTTSRDDFISFKETEAFQPSAFISADESFVAWTQENVSNILQGYLIQTTEDIWGSLYSLGGASSVFTIRDSNLADNQPIVVRINDKGQGVAVWAQYDGPNRRLYVATYESKHWSKPTSLSADSFSDSSAGDSLVNIDAAINDSGDIVIVWMQLVGSDMQTFKAEKRNGEWLSIPNIYQQVSENSFEKTNCHVAINNDGTTIIAWVQNSALPGHQKQVFRTVYQTNSDEIFNWEPIESVSFDFNVPVLNFYISLNNNGHGIVAWIESGHVYKQEYKSGNWGSIEQVSVTGSNADDCSVAIDDHDRATIVWKQQQSGVDHIYRAELIDGKWIKPKNLNNPLDRGTTSATAPNVLQNECRTTVTWIQDDAEGNAQLYMMQYR